MTPTTRSSSSKSTTPASKRTSLLDTPPEVMLTILSGLDPVDVASLAMTSRALHTYTGPGNLLLWKMLFLELFDSPDPDQPAIGDYCTCVKDRCKARGIVRAPHRHKQKKERPFVLRTLHGILATTPRSIPLHSSKNAACLESLLSSRSVIADWLGVAPLRNRPMLADDDGGGSTSLDSEVKELAEIASHLHLAGLSAREIGWLTYKSGQAYREDIYRGTNFDETNLYGPYEQRTDGRLVIDWKMLNGIGVVMALNVHGAWHQWEEDTGQEILPYGFQRAVFWKQPQSQTSKDWACVTGRWNYIYAFIDYNDFFAYNFAPPSLQGPSNNLDGVGEAVGGINSLELALMPDEEQEWDLYPDDPFPPLKFEGESTGPTGSRFRGLVKMLGGGYRHWEFTIRYSGSDRWVTSGVEVGGRGVYGIWSDVLHEDLSPCGPVWYFRS